MSVVILKKWLAVPNFIKIFIGSQGVGFGVLKKSMTFDWGFSRRERS